MPRLVTYAQISKVLDAKGMICRGGFHPTDADLIPGDVKTCILVGNAGAQFWRSFSSERPEGADPIEAWTKRVLEEIAAELGAKVLLASTGPPFLPFLEWAKRSEPVTESPIGLLIHPVYGLWHAYRGMLLFQEKIALPEAPSRTPGAQGMSPCDTCADQPCMRACPVKAVNGDIFDVAACSGFISTAEGADCLSSGCRARRACPVGKGYVYEPAQALHHMQGFLDTFGRVQGQK